MSISPEIHDALVTVTGAEWARDDGASRLAYGTDALQRGTPADLVLIPGTVEDIARIARICNDQRIPLVARGAGTGYTGGAVPIRGGVLLSMERFDRILEVDSANQIAVVQPNVLTYQLQDAAEARGLFYPPDPASQKISALGGNVAECAGGPRAVKYGTTRRYVLALQAVLPTGEIIRTGSKAVKNVVGYDLTQLLVGSEGTLAIITEITLRLIPKPRARATLQATFRDVGAAVAGVTALLEAARRARHHRAHRRRLAARGGTSTLAEPSPRLAPAACSCSRSMASPPESPRKLALVEDACRRAGALVSEARGRRRSERQLLWEARRELSYALRAARPAKINHDVSGAAWPRASAVRPGVTTGT